MTRTKLQTVWPTKAAAVAYLETVRWTNGRYCPYCFAPHATSRHSERGTRSDRWQCSACKRSFSVITGTLFHDTRADLRIWFGLIMRLARNDQLNVSATAIELKTRPATVRRLVRCIEAGLKKRDALLLALMGNWK